MTKFAWASWDGGGNLAPSLGVARALTDRGHEVEFFGRPQMVERVEAGGFTATGLVESFSQLDRYGDIALPTIWGYTSSPAVGDELVAVVAERNVDVVVVDCMFATALSVAPRFDRPTAVMVHTFLDRIFSFWQSNLAFQGRLREEAGFPGLPGLDVLWGERDLIQVNALSAFDGPPATDWRHVRHGAPVLDNETRAVPFAAPWSDDDPTPMVLLSFSTVAEQGSPAKLQIALDALAPLPVHVVATTGGVVEPSELQAPPNAHVVPFADHGPLMDRAALVVGHGGHGTTMRCLSKGVPMVCIPALAGDQAPNAKMVEEWGAGIALPGDVDAGRVRAAVEKMLSTSSFTTEARRLAANFTGMDGAQLAADSLETLTQPT
jgi:UDP:flavonoid glycosyltransferase YjiC (YdhE family)